METEPAASEASLLLGAALLLGRAETDPAALTTANQGLGREKWRGEGFGNWRGQSEAGRIRGIARGRGGDRGRTEGLRTDDWFGSASFA